MKCLSETFVTHTLFRILTAAVGLTSASKNGLISETNTEVSFLGLVTI